MDRSPEPESRNWAAMGQAGSLLVGPVLVGVAIDWYADCSPWGTIGGAGFGLLACFSYLIRLANRLNRSDGPERGEKLPPK